MTTGYSVVDFMELPPVERYIVRMVLREVTVAYSRLREAVAKYAIDIAMLDDALEHLTRTRWITLQTSDGHRIYRVSPFAQNSSVNRNLWDNLALDDMEEPESAELRTDPDNPALPIRSGGKRVLPQSIWDCLCEPETGEVSATRGASLFDKLITSSPDDV